jgi:hypothetical protein
MSLASFQGFAAERTYGAHLEQTWEEEEAHIRFAHQSQSEWYIEDSVNRAREARAIRHQQYEESYQRDDEQQRMAEMGRMDLANEMGRMNFVDNAWYAEQQARKLKKPEGWDEYYSNLKSLYPSPGTVSNAKTREKYETALVSAIITRAIVKSVGLEKVNSDPVKYGVCIDRMMANSFDEYKGIMGSTLYSSAFGGGSSRITDELLIEDKWDPKLALQAVQNYKNMSKQQVRERLREVCKLLEECCTSEEIDDLVQKRHIGGTLARNKDKKTNCNVM